MMDADIALGVMTFNSLGSFLVFAMWEYMKTRRELAASAADRRNPSLGQAAGDYVPTQG